MRSGFFVGIKNTADTKDVCRGKGSNDSKVLVEVKKRGCAVSVGDAQCSSLLAYIRERVHANSHDARSPGGQHGCQVGGRELDQMAVDEDGAGSAVFGEVTQVRMFFEGQSSVLKERNERTELSAQDASRFFGIRIGLIRPVAPEKTIHKRRGAILG